MGNTPISKKYTKGVKLGKGSFATVSKYTRKADGKEFAIKQINKKSLKTPEDLALIHEEVEVMRKIDHPNCVKFEEVLESKTDLFIVLELLTGGELFDAIVAKGNYSEAEASAAIASVNNAIGYLHSIGVTHRDLKPENLIYTDHTDTKQLKVTDFGLAKKGSRGASMHTACGTPGYVAPEVLKQKAYGHEVDMWSLGVILYILLCGFPPFYHESTTALYKQIKKGEFDFPDPYWTDISEPAKDLVRRLLTVEPANRYTAEQVKKHPWISGGSAPTRDLGGKHQLQFKLLQARRDFRKGVKLIIAVNRFVKGLRRVQRGGK